MVWLLADLNWLYGWVFQFSLGFIAIFLILLILVQRGRGGGLTGALGGMGGQSAFGTKAGDVFTRITIVVAACWILLSMAVLKVSASKSGKLTGAGTGAAMEPSGKTDDDKKLFPDLGKSLGTAGSPDSETKPEATPEKEPAEKAEKTDEKDKTTPPTDPAPEDKSATPPKSETPADKTDKTEKTNDKSQPAPTDADKAKTE